MNSIIYAIQVLYPGETSFKFTLTYGLQSDEDILDNVFARFNSGSGSESEDFLRLRIRSMSVNDFVAVNGRWYQCKGIGWEETTEKNAVDFDEAVRKHPNFLSDGAWCCALAVARSLET